VIGVGSGPPVPARRGLRASERDCWIALSLVPGIGPAGFAHLVSRHGSAFAAWDAGPAGLDGIGRLGAGTEEALTIMRRESPREIARCLTERTAASGGRVVTGLDEDYPRALRTLDPRPPTLFVAGDGTALLERAVAIVGTRRATGYGLATATDLADELARAGIVVVSGLALGIDGAAHRAALNARGRTIAVLPSALSRIYPPRHCGLARDIVRAGGVLVSEVAIGAPVGRPDFARRNRIIAGLSEAVVVIEARPLRRVADRRGGHRDRPGAVCRSGANRLTGGSRLQSADRGQRRRDRDVRRSAAEADRPFPGSEATRRERAVRGRGPGASPAARTEWIDRGIG
jgi:DNA protecting protein DprA